MTQNQNEMYITADNLGTVHAFTTRAGGVSRGAYASLNLGVSRGDAQDAVRENYRRLWTALTISPKVPVLSRQVHGSVVKAVTREDCLPDLFDPVPYEADGLVTAERGLPLVIFTADCIPILLHDPAHGVIGAVHAGWRGTVRDIAGAAIRAMEALGGRPGEVRAAIGPGIGPCCFETGGEVPRAVRAVLGGGAEAYISQNGGKSFVDLKGVNRALLLRAGLEAAHIWVSGLCTRCSCDRFWSHRINGPDRGSQAAVIMMR